LGERDVAPQHFRERSHYSVLENSRRAPDHSEVRTVISKSGRPEDGTDPKLINMAEIFVDLRPAAEWRKHQTKESLIAQMNKALSAMPSIEPSFSQPIRDNILESISQIDGQIVIKSSAKI